MALIDCPECKRQVSTKATSCPGCGSPIQTAGADTPVQAVEKTAKKYKLALVVVYPVMFLSFLFAIISQPKHGPAEFFTVLCWVCFSLSLLVWAVIKFRIWWHHG